MVEGCEILTIITNCAINFKMVPLQMETRSVTTHRQLPSSKCLKLYFWLSSNPEVQFCKLILWETSWSPVMQSAIFHNHKKVAVPFLLWYDWSINAVSNPVLATPGKVKIFYSIFPGITYVSQLFRKPAVLWHTVVMCFFCLQFKIVLQSSRRCVMGIC